LNENDNAKSVYVDSSEQRNLNVAKFSKVCCSESSSEFRWT